MYRCLILTLQLFIKSKLSFATCKFHKWLPLENCYLLQILIFKSDCFIVCYKLQNNALDTLSSAYIKYRCLILTLQYFLKSKLPFATYTFYKWRPLENCRLLFTSNIYFLLLFRLFHRVLLTSK